MHKTPVILIKKNKKELYVSKYMIRKTEGGQLVFDLIKYMGNLHDLKRLNTEEAYLALPVLNYHSSLVSVKTYIGKEFEDIAQTQDVVVTLNDKDNPKYFPYRVQIFCNNMALITDDNLPETPENEIKIEYQESGETEIFRLRKKRNRASAVDLSKLYTERNPFYAQVENIGWIDQKNYYKVSQIYTFTKEWANEMLEKLKAVDADMIVFPTFSGEWITEKVNCEKRVLSPEVYSKKLAKREAKKDFWENYLKTFEECKIVYCKKFPYGKLVK